MKKNLFWCTVIFIALMTACSPAQTVSGTYNGTYTSSGNLPNSNGNGTVRVTENGENNVNMVFSSSGNPDISISNASLTRYSFLNVNYFSIDLNTSSISLSGTMYENSRTLDISYYDSDTTDFDFSFEGTK